MGKISDRPDLPDDLMDTDMLGIYRPGIPNVDYKSSARKFFHLLGQSIVIPDMSINHVNGVPDNYVGVGVPISSAKGAGLTGGLNLLLTPDPQYWRSEDKVAKGLVLNVYTNIVANDCAQDFNANANGIVAYMVQAYKDSANSATSGQRATINFFKNSGAGLSDAVGNGVLHAPPEIGDAGTFYGKSDVLNTANIANQIGLGGAFSRYYYIMGMQIAAPVITKTFKFRFVLEYI